jgi:hypothetical protein
MFKRYIDMLNLYRYRKIFLLYSIDFYISNEITTRGRNEENKYKIRIYAEDYK